MRTLDKRQAIDVLGKLEILNWLIPQSSGRADSFTWSVTPTVHTVFADKAKSEKKRREKAQSLIKESLTSN